jgi:lipopolysaccharide biosynthesis regulator YciM
MGTLVKAYQDADRLDKALPLAEQALEKAKVKFGPDHSRTLNAQWRLGIVCYTARQFDRSVPLFEEMLRVKRARYGEADPDTIKTALNLAVNYRAAKRPAEAIALLDEWLPRSRQKLGLDHPCTAYGLSALAQTYVQEAEFDRAVPVYRELLDAQRKLPADHPDRASTMASLGQCLLSAGKPAEAIALLKQVRDAQVKKLGPDDPATLRTLNSLAAAYWEAKQLDRSIPLFEQTLAARRKKLGDQHPDTLATLANLGVNYRDDGRLAEALRLLEQAHRGGREHASLRWVGDELLTAYLRAGKTADAGSLVKKNLAAARKALAADSRPLAAALARNGLALLELKRWADAEPILREALAIRAAKGPDAWTTFNSKSMLGASLLGQQKYAAAEPLLLQGYEGLKQREAKIPPLFKQARLTEALERLVRLYEATGQKDKADEWRKELEASQATRKKAASSPE